MNDWKNLQIIKSHRLFVVAFAMCVALLLPHTGWALPVARLRNVKPVVHVRLADGKNFQVVREKQAVRFGDVIRTQKNGKAEILFSNGTRVAMNGGSQIQIVAPETKNSPLVIRVFGALSEVFVRPRGNTQIRTAAAIAAARGTAFLVRLPDENTAVVTVTEDEVDFFNDAGRVLLAAGQRSTAVVGQAPSPPIVVDASGELAWTAEIAALPVEYETALALPDLQAAEAAAANNPADVATQIRLGEALRAAGNAAGAQAAYRRALQADSNNAGARVGLALTALSLGDADEANAALQPIADDAQAASIQGLIALQQGEYSQATTLLQSAVEKNPNLYQAHALLALARLSTNQIPAAREAALRSVQLEPRSAQAQSTLSIVSFFSGAQYQREAELAANRAVELNPNSPLALLVQGRVLLMEREPDEAAVAFAQAAALMPRLEIAQREWGASLLLQGRPASAEKAYRRALAINGESAEAQTGLGVALLRQGQVEAARAAQQRALELDGDNDTVRANYAALLIEQGELDEAVTQLGDGDGTPSTRGIIYVRLSEASLFQHRLVDAQDYARRAVAASPDSAVAHYQLGRVHLELERYTQAVQAFRKAVLLDRDFAEARYALGYARELVETGRDPSRPSAAAGAGALNSVARALNIQNLQTPGAEERIQAAIQDPVVVRTATRSYGDTEVKLSLGEDGAREGEVSHLRLRNDRRGVLGVTAQHESFDEVNDLSNSDFTANRFGIVFGQKAKDNPSGVFAMAQYERLEEGFNKGDQPAVVASSRINARKPRILIGGNWQHNSKSRTRGLVQYVDVKKALINPLFGDRQDDGVESYNAELRHDRRFGLRHYVSAGIFAGRRTRELNLFLAGFPPVFQDQRTRNEIDLTVYGAYVRDEYSASKRLRLTGELKAVSIKGKSSFEFVEPVPSQGDVVVTNKSVLLPTLIADYRAGSNTDVRLRLRRLYGNIRDFELLAPVDTFISPLSDLSLLGYGGIGTSIELEADHTFRNGSFFRIGVFQQNLKDALEPTSDGSGNAIPRARLRGVRVGYEGNLNRDVSFFVSAAYTRATDLTLGQNIANIPNWTGEAGLQYLREDGWFIQPSLYYQGTRFREDRSRADAFSVANLRIGKRFGLRGAVFVELRNVFDKDYDILELEQPGRQLRVGFNGRF